MRFNVFVTSFLTIGVMILSGVATASPTDNGRWMQVRNYDNGQDSQLYYRRELSHDVVKARDIHLVDNTIYARTFNDAALRLRDALDKLLEDRSTKKPFRFDITYSPNANVSPADKPAVESSVRHYHDNSILYEDSTSAIVMGATPTEVKVQFSDTGDRHADGRVISIDRSVFK